VDRWRYKGDVRTMKTNALMVGGVLSAALLLSACQPQVEAPAANQPQNSSGNSSGTVVPGNGQANGRGNGQAPGQGAGQGNTRGTAVPARGAPQAVPTQQVTANASIVADGQLALATPSVLATFATSGKVQVVNVVPGQAVKTGDVLAELDSTTLSNTLTAAQDKLALQQAQIDKSVAPATKFDLDNAKAALRSAYSAYNALKKGPDVNTVDVALRSWNQAKNSLYSSQLSRDTICRFVPGKPDPVHEVEAKKSPDCKSAELGVQDAQASESTAHQKYIDAQAPTTQADLTKSWASVVQAQTSLETLQNGASAQQQALNQVQLKQAQVAVERAKRALNDVKLISPCTCVVQDVTLTPGTNASGGIILVDTASIEFETTNLSEQDVVNVTVGQPATVELKAFSQTFTGTVTAILPVASGTKGTLALFTAIISLDPTNAALRPGMTGQTNIPQK